jgi:histidine ammonia-lyase
METSTGQEDVQSFGFEAVECLTTAVDGLRDILACELLAVHQAGVLGGPPAGVAEALATALGQVAGSLPAGAGDRPFGRDLDKLVELLTAGWARNAPSALAPWSSPAR